MAPMRATRPASLREAYGLLDALSRSTPAAEISRRRMLDICYEGKPLGDHSLRMRSAAPGETYYAKEFGEAVSFAHLAVGADIDGQIVDVVSRLPPEPDLLVALVDGSEVYVEVAQVTEEHSARASSTMSAINKHIHNRDAADPAFAAARQGRHIDFRFPAIPTSRETKAVADEMVTVLYTTDFATVERRTLLRPSATITPVLHRLGVSYYIGAGTSTALSAQLDANTFDPDDAADDLDARLADKMSKSYEAGRPIWLALALNDHMHVSSLSMEAIRRRLPSTIGQFDLVIMGTLEEAVILQNRYT